MRTQIYDHRSGLKVVPNDIVADVKNIIWNINPALSKKTVSSLKESVVFRLNVFQNLPPPGRWNAKDVSFISFG